MVFSVSLMVNGNEVFLTDFTVDTTLTNTAATLTINYRKSVYGIKIERDGYKHLVIAAIAKGTEYIVADIKVDTDLKTMLAVKIIAFSKAFGILLHNTPEI